MKIDMKELSEFIIKAKKQTYAIGGKEVAPERPGFKELKYAEGDYCYRDSYAGFFFAPGQEIVRLKSMPIWSMSYSGGMLSKHHGDTALAEKTFDFLKKALTKIPANKPFRGPSRFKTGDFEYVNRVKGDITDFIGQEKILFKGKEIFMQNYIGGVIVQRES
jgi:hypothetical protein